MTNLLSDFSHLNRLESWSYYDLVVYVVSSQLRQSLVSRRRVRSEEPPRQVVWPRPSVSLSVAVVIVTDMHVSIQQ